MPSSYTHNVCSSARSDQAATNRRDAEQSTSFTTCRLLSCLFTLQFTSLQLSSLPLPSAIWLLFCLPSAVDSSARIVQQTDGRHTTFLELGARRRRRNSRRSSNNCTARRLSARARRQQQQQQVSRRKRRCSTKGEAGNINA